ncbi:MAG TPA: hypothetical protein VIK91_08905 [Nannocystis sp.]
MPRLTVTELFTALDGMEVEGGCGDCRAVQRIERIRGFDRITKITVVHDDSCPALARKAGRWGR